MIKINNKYSQTAEKISLSPAQKKAFAYFEENGFPTRRNEWYKYTKINHFRNLTPYTVFEIPKEIPAFFTHHYIKSHLLVFVNGVFAPQLSNYTEEKGLHIYFDNAVEKDNEITDSFQALAYSFSPNILTIKVDKNTQVEKPIVIIHLAKEQGEEQLICTRQNVIVEENAEVEILEDYLNPSAFDFNINLCANYNLSANAHLHLNIYQEEDNFYFVGNRYFKQAKDSNLQVNNPALHADWVRNFYHIDSFEQGTHCDINGTFLNEGKMHSDQRIAINHLAPNCTSSQLFRGVLYDDSSAVFNGKVYVDKIAQKTNAFQSNKNIVLSENAIINTKPELEIYADDVKCSHGATTGQLDENAIFYAMQRGIPKEKAKALIVFAFAQETLTNIKNKAIKDFFERRLVLKMGLKEYSTADFSQ